MYKSKTEQQLNIKTERLNKMTKFTAKRHLYNNGLIELEIEEIKVRNKKYNRCNLNSTIYRKSLTRSFEKIFMEAIDEAFYSIGIDCAQTIYYCLEKKFLLNKQNIPDQIEEFSVAMNKIFGIAAKILEIRIMNNLYQRTEKSFKYTNKKTLDFVNYVQSIKNVYDPIV